MFMFSNFALLVSNFIGLVWKKLIDDDWIGSGKVRRREYICQNNVKTLFVLILVKQE